MSSPNRHDKKRGIAIHRRWLALSIIAATLIVTSTIYVLFEYRDSRHTFSRHLQVLANVMASDVKQAIHTNDSIAANALLKTLETESDMRRVVIYHNDGAPFVERSWRTQEQPSEAARTWLTRALEAKTSNFNFDGDALTFVTPIDDKGDTIAYLHFEVGLAHLDRQLFASLGAIGITIAVLMITVFVIMKRFKHQVANPLQQLIHGMREVARNNNHALKIDTDSGDPAINELVEGFNALLKKVGRHHHDIESIQRELDAQVAERTAGIAEAKALAEAGSRAKSEFLTAMSHEIRTPINGVLGMTELLLGSGLAPRQQRLAETAYRSAETLLDVITSILDFSKIETGRLQLNQETFKLRALFDDTLALFAEEARRKGIELVVDVSPQLPEWVSGDATRLRQILMHLLGNAVKFTERGEVLLNVSTAERHDGDIDLDIEIADTGPGIPQEIQERIFEAFVQADSSASRQHGGPGLGLAITQHLTDLMGGGITLESEPGNGSRFNVSVKMTPANSETGDSPTPNGLSGVRILVVDSHPINREHLCRQLFAWGVREDCAGDTAEALAMMRRAANEEDPYLYCILDWQIQETNGIALTRAIRADHLIPPTGLIMLGSSGDDGIARQAHDAGIDCYLTRPARQSHLLACLLDLQDTGIGKPKTVDAHEHHQNSYRVLLAEDNHVNQEIVLGMLETLGHRVDVADNGKFAIEMNQTHTYDLILMDCHMPAVDGFAASKHIRAQERARRLRRVPIIALTADVQDGIEQRCRNAGMDDYMSKPVRQDDLSARLDKWLAATRISAAPGDPPHTPLTSPRQLDPQAIEQLRQLGNRRGHDVLGKVANVFLEETPKLLKRLHEGVASGSTETVKQIAHSLKSSSANLGAMQLMHVCAELEAAARAEETALVRQLFDKLQPIAKESLNAVEQLPKDPMPRKTVSGTQASVARGNKGRCILIVDDDLGFRTTTAEALKAEGFDSCEAANGDQALRMVERHHPDLILLDAVMDGMDGFETCSRLRSTPAGHDVPIIMVTGLEDAASVERAFYSGATSFTSKPVTYPVLVQQIRFTLRASRTESELRNHKTMLQTAQRVARLGYWRWDPTSDVFEMSENLFELCGVEPIHFDASLQGFLSLVCEEDRTRVHDRLIAAKNEHALGSLDYRMIGMSGEPIMVQQDLELITSTGRVHLLGTVQDVGRQRESEEQIRKMAYYDALTGLASRSHLMQHLEDTIKLAHRRNHQFCMLFLDLDGFKDVNDTMGHDVGDFMLVSVARRLQQVVRDVDFVARLGGDEFCILLDHQHDELDAAEVATRCLEAISQPIDIGNQIWRPNVSIGLARFPDDGDTSGLLLKAADSAMYAAKHSGKHRYAFYRPEMTEEAERRLATERAVRHAIEHDEFELYYQPQVDLRDGRIVAVEALARWRHEAHGMVSPENFIPTLERIGLISRLGNWVISQACLQAKAWLDAGLPELRVAINISPLHFHDPSILETVKQALTDSELPPHLFEIEITETSVQFDTKAMIVLKQLRALGIRISIDDFGTGYSSLGSLKHLPINTLKIDRVFITDMLNNSEDAVMLGTIIGLAHALNYTVVAEGVEETGQINVLAGLHCDLAQGYYFAEPVSPEQIPTMLNNMPLFGPIGQKPHRDDKLSAGGADV